MLKEETADQGIGPTIQAAEEVFQEVKERSLHCSLGDRRPNTVNTIESDGQSMEILAEPCERNLECRLLQKSPSPSFFDPEEEDVERFEEWAETDPALAGMSCQSAQSSPFTRQEINPEVGLTVRA